MSTRWAIARQKGDSWEGRYVHSDGYPSHALRELFKIREEGFGGDTEAMLKYYLDDHCAWSWVGPDVTTPAGYVEFENRPNSEDRDAYKAFMRRNLCYCHGDRHEDAWDDWFRGDEEDTSDLEWAYVLNDVGVSVFQPRRDADRKRAGGWVLLGMVRWDQELTDDKVTAIECGENLERCTHCAYVHFPEAEGTRYGVDVWLGKEPPNHHDMTHVCIDGKVYKVGGGHLERTFTGYGNRWFSYLKAKNGRRIERPTVVFGEDGEATPAPGVEWIFEGLPGRQVATATSA